MLAPCKGESYRSLRITPHDSFIPPHQRSSTPDSGNHPRKHTTLELQSGKPTSASLPYPHGCTSRPTMPEEHSTFHFRIQELPSQDSAVRAYWIGSPSSSRSRCHAPCTRPTTGTSPPRASSARASCCCGSACPCGTSCRGTSYWTGCMAGSGTSREFGS